MTPPPAIRVMLVDDHQILREGIAFLLLAFGDIELVGEARNGEEAIRMCAQARPDVVLMDVQMSGMNGIATTWAIKRAYPQVQIVILSGFHTPELVQEAMQAGAVGYLLKDTSMNVLAGAIRAAVDGQTTLAAEVAQALLQATPRSTPVPRHNLTERQRDILALLARGLSNHEIAERLALSPYTIRNHVSEILAKLGATSRAEVAVLAVQLGIVGSVSLRSEAMPQL